MAPTVLELDGVTSFKSMSKSSFRFMLTVKSGKLNVWLENRKSKKQWQSGFLALDEFVTAQNAIPGAKLEQYAECFRAALEDADGKTEKAPVERELLDDDDQLKLQFVVHIKVFSSSWSPVYSLTLKPVAIERIDIAESRLFDVMQEVERIASSRTVCPSVTQLEVATASGCNQEVSWRPISSKFFVIESNTKINVQSDGVYLVAMHIYQAVNSYSYFQLLKDGSEVFKCSMPYFQGCQGFFTSASWIVQLKKGEKLSLIGVDFSIQTGSTMVITKLCG